MGGWQSTTAPTSSPSAAEKAVRWKLYRAIEEGDRERVAAFLDAGADIETPWGPLRCPPLVRAAGCGKVGVARLLVDRGARLDSVNGDGDTALHVAIRKGDVEMVEMLLGRCGLEVKDSDGATPLLRAVAHGQHELANWLLDRGARADVVGPGGWTALHYAVQGGCPSLEGILKHVDVDAQERDSAQTALHMAVMGHSEQHVRQLLHAGATVDVRDVWGMTPLHRACEGIQPQLVRELLQRGAPVNAVDGEGQTPLLCATRRMRRRSSSDVLEMVHVLLDNRADRTIRDRRGKSARDWAAQRRCDAVVEVLDTYVPVKLQLEQVLLGMRRGEESALGRFASHAMFEPKVMLIVAAFAGGKGSGAFDKLQREAVGGGGGGSASVRPAKRSRLS